MSEKKDNSISYQLTNVETTGFGENQEIFPQEIFFSQEFEADIPKLSVSRLRNFALQNDNVKLNEEVITLKQNQFLETLENDNPI